MVDPDYNFRAPPPPKESSAEKRQRVLKERLDADNFLKYRMETISDVYSVPLRRMHYDRVIRYAVPNVDQLRTRIRDDYMNISTIHVLKLEDSGEINARSKVLGQTIPAQFYRSTKLAAWKMHRYKHWTPSTGTQPVVQLSSRTKRAMNKGKDPEVSFVDYKQMLEKEVAHARELESKYAPRMRGGNKGGNFFLIKDYGNRTARKGSMSGEFSGTLSGKGYKKFDKGDAERRASLEARHQAIALDDDKLVSFSNLIQAQSDGKPSEATPSEVAPSEVAPSEIPSEVAPSEFPSEVAPNEIAPSEAAPSEAEPSEAAPSEVPPSEVPPSEAPASTSRALSEAVTSEAPSEGAPSEGAPSETGQSEGGTTETASVPSNVTTIEDDSERMKPE